MAQLINEAINPKGESDRFTLEIMPCRSSKIKHVRKASDRPDIAGYSDASSGTVCVPSGKTAFERTIRYHEALHAEHTPRASRPKDMLDQALEDSRLHRYASRSAESSCTQARRDELAVALRELRGLRKMAKVGYRLGAAQSLATMRAKAILEASTVPPSHAKLLADVCSKIGPNAAHDMGRAIKALRESDGDTEGEPWRKARGYAGRYFTRDFDSTQPQPKPKAKTSSDGASGESQRAESSSSDSESDSDTQSSTGKATPAPNDDSGEDTDEEDGSGAGDEDTPDTDEDKDTDGESSGESDGDEDTPDSEDSTSDGDGDKDEDTGEDIPDEPIAPMEPIKRKLVPARKAFDADEYTADLTPACDAAQFREMNAKAPLKVYIRRPDMGINRVKLDLGRRGLLPVMAGSRINPAKLVSGVTTPGVRMFQRKVNQGGNGTILIDASGSMGIPESTLVAFCEKAPALTIAFYNAPDDWSRHGNIFIYAANGYRANLSGVRGGVYSIPHYGTGNVIDYHAMAWLIKQPGPHYIVTDCGFTGPWSDAAIVLFRKLVAAKQLELVPDLTAMAYILEARKRHSLKPVRELVREHFTRQSCEHSYIEPKHRQAYIDRQLEWYDELCKGGEG